MEKASNLFANYLMSVHETTIEQGELVWEAIDLYNDELDENLVPQEELEILPELLTVLSACSDDHLGNEWMFGLIVDQSSGDWLYSLCTKNGEVVGRNIHREFSLT